MIKYLSKSDQAFDHITELENEDKRKELKIRYVEKAFRMSGSQ